MPPSEVTANYSRAYYTKWPTMHFHQIKSAIYFDQNKPKVLKGVFYTIVIMANNMGWLFLS